MRSSRLSCLVVLPVLAACSFFAPSSQVRGNRVDPDVIKELTPGTSTKADATALLGSPTAHASFDENTWLYIGEQTRPRVGGHQEVMNQDVYALTFNPQGDLTGIKHYTQDDSVPITVASGATPSPGSETSFMQQLFGSIGRVGPTGLGGLGGGGGGSGLGGLGGGGQAPSGGGNTNTR